MARPDGIEVLSGSIAKELFRRMLPQALDRFPDIQRCAFPRTVADLTLGKESEIGDFLGHWVLDDRRMAFRKGVLLLQAIDEGIRNQREAISRAQSVEQIAGFLLSGIPEHLASLSAPIELERVVEEVADTFAEHPSLLDRASVVVQQPPNLDEQWLQKLEKMLESCVLKVVDDKGAISTAFALCERGHILTAAHVALDERNEPLSLRLAFRYGDVRAREETEEREATVNYSNTSIDIALLQLVAQHWQEFRTCGLFGEREEEHPKLSTQDENSLKGHRVLCFGYQSQPTRDGHRFIDPCPVRATVAPHKPLRNIEFVNEHGEVIHRQPCLVLIIAEGEERIGQGMSGGPILDLETGEIIAMITGAQRLGRIDQPYGKGKERLPLAEYGFGVLLRDIAESWPEFEQCCLKG